MIWFAISMIIQVGCIIHVIRNHRNPAWIFAIIALPLVGGALYFALDVMPAASTNRPVRFARAQAGPVVHPEREVRDARGALQQADTAANRVRLADGLSALDRHSEALPLYREALDMDRDPDPSTQVKLARALFESGHAAEALTTIEALPISPDSGEADRRAFLQAQILAYLGHREEALAIYADVVTRLPGDEARCHYVVLLLKAGQRARARAVLEQVETRIKRLDPAQLVAEERMYLWAMRELAKLRG